jgi:riboflavin synthase
MFTGIIEATGKILRLKQNNRGASLLLDAGVLAKRTRKGDSIAVNGVCLTVVHKTGGKLGFDISAETWQRSNFSTYRETDQLNLELPVTAETFLSGHLVQGHVDGVGRVRNWIRKGEDVKLLIDLRGDLLRYCVLKGSIAINGVSLTIASQTNRTIGVALIPYTLKNTNLDSLRKGDVVNIETDIIGRYVVSAVKKAYDKP